MKSLILTIYAYSSFVSPWGPGPKLVEEFKKQCKCEVELKDMGDSNLFFDRISKKKQSSEIDVLLGMDQLTIDKLQNIKWFEEPSFYDWAPMAFVYKKSALKDPPKSLDDLLDERFKNQILLQDPRLSVPGMQFLTWVYLAKKEKTKEFLQKLKPQIHSISPSWSTAYGLFKKDQAKLVFTYLTSPVYHWTEEKDENFAAAGFSEKHPAQTEWAGVPMGCKQCDLGKKFIKYLESDAGQKILMNKNYMLPINPKLISGTPYERLPKVDIYLADEYGKVKSEDLLKIWKDVFQ
jgi:thiamine transport system substrate-binding protein